MRAKYAMMVVFVYHHILLAVKVCAIAPRAEEGSIKFVLADPEPQ